MKGFSLYLVRCVWFSQLLHPATLHQLKFLRNYSQLCLLWARVRSPTKLRLHLAMNSPFVNFKLKPGISRSLTGAALLLTATALINAGESKAAEFECFLSSLSTCGGLVGDKNFTGFSLSGFTPRANDKLFVSMFDGYYSVQTNFSPSTAGTVNGRLMYNVAIVGTPSTFDEVEVSVSGGPTSAGNPMITSTITGIAPPFTTDSSAPSVKSFADNIKTIAVDQRFTASGTRRLSSFTTTFTQNVPGPLPLLGGAAAFGFSRRLRSRIKTSAAA